jgi:hypothetical protein
MSLYGNVMIPLGLTAIYEDATEAEEEAADHEHNGWAVITLNGSVPVARLRLGFVKWSDGGPKEAMEQAVAGWLADRAGDQE